MVGNRTVRKASTELLLEGCLPSVEQSLETFVVLYHVPSLLEKLLALHIGGNMGRSRMELRLKLPKCGHRNGCVAETNPSLCRVMWQLNAGLLQCCIRRGGVPRSEADAVLLLHLLREWMVL